VQIDAPAWMSEVDAMKEYFSQFGSHLPEGLVAELNGVRSRLEGAAAASAV
jgi:GTP-dependent phosphoenolpyruvate carboxykinase